MSLTAAEMTAEAMGPISPELALVCPELGAHARAALPQRPWELFAGPSEPPGSDVAAVDEPGRRRPLRFLRKLAIAPVAAAGVVTAVLWFGSDRPSSSAPSAAVAPVSGIAAARNVGPIGDVRAGGYVFDGGVLQVGADGTTIKALSFTSGCAKSGTIEGPVPLRGHLFRFSRSLEGKPIRVVVTGVFFEPTEATLLIDLQGGACGSQTLRATARLS